MGSADLHLLDRGARRAVVFIHGWQLSAEVDAADFEAVFAGIDGWRRLYIDLPGMGGSPPQPGLSDLDGLVAALTEVVDARLGNESFALAGTSAGAFLAYGLAARLGRRVRGLLLRVPMLVHTEDDRELPMTAVSLPAALSAASEAKRATVWEPARSQANAAYLDTFSSVARIGVEKRLEMPALVLLGRQDDVVGYRDALRWLDLLPRGTFVVLDRENHLVPVDDPTLFIALTQEWLRRVDETWSEG